jgi:hypothetical protein
MAIKNHSLHSFIIHHSSFIHVSKKQVWELSRSKARSSKAQVVLVFFRLIDLICVHNFHVAARGGHKWRGRVLPAAPFATASGWLKRK